MENSSRSSDDKAPSCSVPHRGVGLLSGDMHVCGEWMKRRPASIQLLDWVLRGVAQVMMANNPLCGLLITGSLFLHNPWWAVNGLMGTFVSTVSAIMLGQNRDHISAGLYGYNGTLVGVLMAVFSARGSWYWWLLLPNMFLSMLCPVVSSALSSVARKWDLPVFTLPFNILVCLHVAATGAEHPVFPTVTFHSTPHMLNDSNKSLSIPQLLLSVPIGVGQVYGCDSPWTGGLILLALLLASPAICFHAILGSTVGMVSGLALAAPRQDIYSGLWGCNSALSCIAIGGVFYVITWQTHLLSLLCAFFCAYMTSATSNVMSALALPGCTWPFCLSTLIFLLISSESPSICRLPLSVVSHPEENLRYRRKRPEASEEAPHGRPSSSREEELPKDGGGPHVCVAMENVCRDSTLVS